MNRSYCRIRLTSEAPRPASLIRSDSFANVMNRLVYKES